jgi:hypothetical protein
LLHSGQPVSYPKSLYDIRFVPTHRFQTPFRGNQQLCGNPDSLPSPALPVRPNRLELQRIELACINTQQFELCLNTLRYHVWSKSRYDLTRHHRQDIRIVHHSCVGQILVKAQRQVWLPLEAEKRRVAHNSLIDMAAAG